MQQQETHVVDFLKKDQISGISRPYLGVEIPPIWFAFFASGLPAAPSLTEEALKTDRLCYVRLNHLLNEKIVQANCVRSNLHLLMDIYLCSCHLS